MPGRSRNDTIKPIHESLLAKMPLANIGNYSQPVSIESSFCIASPGTINVVKRRFDSLLKYIDLLSLSRSHGTPLPSQIPALTKR